MIDSYNIDSFDYIWSDQHFHHNNIVKYSMRPGFNPRGDNHDFETHNRLMLQNAQTVITPKDNVLNLGDIAMGKKDAFEKLAPNLPGNNFLLLGNHDKWGVEFYEGLGFTVIDPFSFDYLGMEVFFTHYPMEKLRAKQGNCHGHVHRNPYNATMGHTNLSVEVTGYAPLPFKRVLDDLAHSVMGTPNR